MYGPIWSGLRVTVHRQLPWWLKKGRGHRYPSGLFYERRVQSNGGFFLGNVEDIAVLFVLYMAYLYHCVSGSRGEAQKSRKVEPTCPEPNKYSNWVSPSSSGSGALG
jgi:hypothetical protein